MGSPLMDREAGYQEARLDMMRGDAFALTNHRSRVLNWNQDQASWCEGYAEFLSETSERTDAPDIAAMAWAALDLSTAPPARATPSSAQR